MGIILQAAAPITRDMHASRPARPVAALRGAVWIAALCAVVLFAATAQATTDKPHSSVTGAGPRACSRATRAEVRASFGGVVGVGTGHSYPDGRSVCIFSLNGNNTIALADAKASTGTVSVQLVPIGAKSARAALAHFDAAEHAKHRPGACTSAWKKSCPVTGLGEAAFFLSRAAGGGRSGQLRVLDGAVVIELSSELRFAHSHAWAAAAGRPGYRVDQAALIALGKRIAPRTETTGPALSSARAVFESLAAPKLRLRDTILVSWATPRRSAVLGAPTGYACYHGASRATLSFAQSVAVHAALSCLFTHPAPGTYFFKVTVRFARGARGSSHLLEVTVPTLPPAIGGSVHLTASRTETGTTGDSAGSGTAGSSTTVGATGSGTTPGTAGSGTTDSGAYTYELSWAAPAAPDSEDPSGYYTYDIFVTAQSPGAQPLLVGTSASTTYTYTVPYQPGATDLEFEVGAVHDGVMGPLSAVS